jgi:hypothetical protein
MSAIVIPVSGRRQKCCMALLRGTPRNGMNICECGRQWYVIKPGWAKKWGTDRVYHNGVYVGSPVGYGELPKLIRAVERKAVTA